MLSRVLLSDAFKAEKQTDPSHVDFTALMLFALVHAAGKPLDKTNVFYCLLQEGGFDKHPMISAGDKDFEPTFKTLCLLVTTHVFSCAEAFGDYPSPYSPEEVQKVASQDIIDAVRED